MIPAGFKLYIFKYSLDTFSHVFNVLSDSEEDAKKHFQGWIEFSSIQLDSSGILEVQTIPILSIIPRYNILVQKMPLEVS